MFAKVIQKTNISDAVILILLGMITGSSLNLAGAASDFNHAFGADCAEANAFGARNRAGCSFRRGAG